MRLTDPAEIMERLRPALEKEGVEVEIVGVEGPVINVRARRYAPGVPVAFLVKAIAGTFRKYHPDIQEVCLTEYDPGPEGPSTAPSPEFDKVIKHRPHAVARAMTKVPGIDLSGLDRAQAVRALENAARVWSGQVDRFTIHGLAEDAPRRAAEKWLDFYRQHRSVHPAEGRPGVWVVHLDQECSQPDCTASVDEQVMPGRIVLIPEP